MANPKRSYRSDSRRYQAGLTRGRMLKAVRSILGSRGFEAMTIEEVARRADISAATVYAVFGSKSGLVAGLLQQAAAPDDPTLLRRVTASPTPAVGLRLLAAMTRRMHEAQSSVVDLLQGAGVIAPELTAPEQEREEQRHQAQQQVIEWLQKSQALRRGLRAGQALDILWALTARQLYRMLVRERRWDSEVYERWLGEMMIASLLQDAATESQRR